MLLDLTHTHTHTHNTGSVTYNMFLQPPCVWTQKSLQYVGPTRLSSQSVLNAHNICCLGEGIRIVTSDPWLPPCCMMCYMYYIMCVSQWPLCIGDYFYRCIMCFMYYTRPRMHSQAIQWVGFFAVQKWYVP